MSPPATLCASAVRVVPVPLLRRCDIRPRRDGAPVWSPLPARRRSLPWFVERGARAHIVEQGWRRSCTGGRAVAKDAGRRVEVVRRLFAGSSGSTPIRRRWPPRP